MISEKMSLGLSVRFAPAERGNLEVNYEGGFFSGPGELDGMFCATRFTVPESENHITGVYYLLVPDEASRPTVFRPLGRELGVLEAAVFGILFAESIRSFCTSGYDFGEVKVVLNCMFH